MVSFFGSLKTRLPANDGRMQKQTTSGHDGFAEKTTIFFDGACPLCRAEIEAYKARDSADVFRLVDVSRPDAALPADLLGGQAMARFHAISPDGKLLSGAAAFAEVWKQLPGWRGVGRLASLPPFVLILEVFYRIFLIFRPLLVRLLSRHLDAGAPTGTKRLISRDMTGA